MKTCIEDRVAVYRKLLEAGWELQDTGTNIGLGIQVVEHARQELNRFEDWLVSTAPNVTPPAGEKTVINASAMVCLLS